MSMYGTHHPPFDTDTHTQRTHIKIFCHFSYFIYLLFYAWSGPYAINLPIISFVVSFIHSAVRGECEDNASSSTVWVGGERCLCVASSVCALNNHNHCDRRVAWPEQGGGNRFTLMFALRCSLLFPICILCDQWIVYHFADHLPMDVLSTPRRTHRAQYPARFPAAQRCETVPTSVRFLYDKFMLQYVIY